MKLDNLVVLDIECYTNYFLIAFKNIKSNVVSKVEMRGEDSVLTPTDIALTRKIMKKRTTFGFNSINYDIPVLQYALMDNSCGQLKRLSDFIILNRSLSWQTEKRFNLSPLRGAQHFDLKEVAPGVMISLKLYGGRMHSSTLQDLPYEPERVLNDEEMDVLSDYCVNDLDTTIELYNAVKGQIQLRADMSAEYGTDLMSKSDAQIAEAVFKHGLDNPQRVSNSPTAVTYTAPGYIEFKSQGLRDLLGDMEGNVFSIREANGQVQLPDELKNRKVVIGDTTYKIGIGGLHSMESGQTLKDGPGISVIDKDVAAYYPNIILNLGLYPEHLGDEFLDLYRTIVDRRLAAKAAGDKVADNSLKVTINGCFGKLGSRYSFLYSPDLMLTVTLTGQLSLLMLIEQLEDAGIRIRSANTDGFVGMVPDELRDEYERICSAWETTTRFDLEATHYSVMCSRDVNNYFAVTTDGDVKGKGVFADPSLMKNPQAIIVATAVKELIVSGTPLGDTVEAATDVRQFITVRTVKGGALWRDQYLGKVVRWVYSRDGEAILYKTNGNKVAKSDGAFPMMTLGEIPGTLDRDVYIHEAEKLLESIGYGAA